MPFMTEPMRRSVWRRGFFAPTAPGDQLIHTLKVLPPHCAVRLKHHMPKNHNKENSGGRSIAFIRSKEDVCFSFSRPLWKRFPLFRLLDVIGTPANCIRWSPLRHLGNRQKGFSSWWNFTSRSGIEESELEFIVMLLEGSMQPCQLRPVSQ